MLRGALPAEVLPNLETVLRERLGHRIPERRMQQLAEAVSVLASESGYLDLTEYLALVRTLPVDAPLVQSLVRTVTNKDSYFFRDTATMASLREHILPPLLDRCSGSRVLRVWSAGCSTGEELYSVSVLLQELLVDYETWTVSLVGTDVDESAITRARRADYKEWSLRATPRALRARYFHFDRLTQTYTLDRTFRQNVTFGLHNLADPEVAPSPSTFDLILCRNVLVDFGTEGQADVRRKLRAALCPGGIWLGGPSDPSPGSEWETAVYPGVLVHTPTPSAHAAVVPASPVPPLPPIAGPPVQARPPVSPAQVDRPTTRPESPGPASGDTPPPDLPPLHVPSRKPPAAAIDGDVAFRRALKLANHGELTQARAVLSEIVQNDPLSAEAYLLLSTVEQSLGAVDGAVRELRRAIYLDPSHAEAHLRLGLLLSESGQPDAAIRSLRTTAVLLSALEAPSPDDHELRQTAATQMVRLLREDA